MEPGTPALVALAWHASESHTVLASSGGAPHRPGQKSRLIEQQYWPKLKTSPLFCRKPCDNRNGWLKWDVHNTMMHSRAVETNILDESCSFPRRNGCLVLFLGFILLLHCPNVHLTINFPLANTNNITKIQIYIYCMSTKRRPYCWLILNWHAEVGDEGRLGQFHLEEDLLGAVSLVQSLGGHDGVGETQRHGTGHRHADHLHHLGGRRETQHACWKSYAVSRSLLKAAKTTSETEAAVLLVRLSSGHLWMIAKSGNNWMFCGCAHATGLGK